MNSNERVGDESIPTLPAPCRWAARVVLVALFLLLLFGCAMETALDQTGFMARPGTLLAFGVLMLSLAVIVLAWHRALAERSRRRRGVTLHRAYAHLLFCGLFCLADGIALLVGGISQL